MPCALISVVSILLSIFGQTAPYCVLTSSNVDFTWGIRIFANSTTISQGSLVTVDRVLSIFRPFVGVANDNSLLRLYDFIGYDKDSSGVPCHQDRKASKIVPPPGWPNLKLDKVRDVAFWEFKKSFDVAKGFPFLFPQNGDISELSKSIGTIRNGNKCIMPFFFESPDGRWKLEKASVEITQFQSCKAKFFDDGVHDLEGRYDFCAIRRQDATGASREEGALLLCHGQPVGILGLVGQKKSKELTLFISLITAWEVFKRQDMPKSTSREPTTSMETTSMQTSSMETSSVETSSMETSSVGTTSMATSSMETSSVETTSMETTAEKSSRPPSSSNTTTSNFSITSFTPDFVRTVPKRVRSGGAALVPGVLTLCALTFHGSS